MTHRHARSLATLVALTLLATDAYAGPPLLCQETATGQALPSMAGPADPDRLVADTLAALDGDRPVLERMEVMRRAAIVLGGLSRGHRPGFERDRKSAQAERLLSELIARSSVSDAAGLARFDAGYLAACYAQAELPEDVDAYALVASALARRPDPAMELAAALICTHPSRPERERHLLRAVAGAPGGSPLERSIQVHASRWGWGSIAELRAKASTARS